MVQSGDRPDAGLKGIQLQNIRKRFGNLEVLGGISLGIGQGELCCLLGPSGCGKTTVLRIINGLLEADAGRVYLLGQDITDVAPQKRNLGMVFQNYALFPQINVYENIAYGLRRRKVPAGTIREKVTAALKLVHLPGIEKRRIHELSGGQQQRVALARALVIEPRALLLDEPLSNLDARLRADMREEIKRIQRQLGITTVYVTHDQEEAMSIADRIVVMNNGRVEQTGTPKEIYENPASKFAAAFVGNINFIPGEVVDSELRFLGRKYNVPAGSSLTNGKITCAVRPERTRPVADTGTALRGTVSEAAYYGATIRYRVTVSDDAGTHELMIQVPVSQKALAVGESTGIEINYEDIRFFPDEVQLPASE